MSSEPESPTVLLADDEEELLELYEIWLSEDCEVRTAAAGEAALAAADESVDLAILDRRMPDLSGEEVLAALREQEIDCRAAMLTGMAPEDVGDFDDYLRKPVDQEDLRGLLGVSV